MASKHWIWIVVGALGGSCGCTNLGPRGSAAEPYLQANTRPQPAGDVRHVSYDQPSDEELRLEDFAPQNLTETVRYLTGNGADPEQAKVSYSSAENSYAVAVQARQQNPQADHTHLFAAAAAEYRRAADRWPNSTLEHDALFMLGECLFLADRYPDAEDAYEELLSKYSHSKHIDRIQPRRFRIAQYWLSLDESDRQQFHEFNLFNESRPVRDTFGHAVRVLDRVRLDDPTGKLADDATLLLGNAFLHRRDFLRADEYYTDLRKTFPSSDHQFAAHFLGLKAKLMTYQGPDYSANALNDAEKLVKQILRQFPSEAEVEREYLKRAAAEIRFHKAEREWMLAEHYYRRREFGAARFYYQALITDYTETPFGERSEQRLREIGGLPDIPPKRLSWLINLFPEDESSMPILATGPQETRR